MNDLNKNPVEGLNGNSGESKILEMLARYGIRKTSSGTEITLWGTGKPKREFLFVDDLADALLFLMENYEGEKHLNIGTGEDIEIGEIAKLIARIVCYKGDIIYDRTKPDGTPQKLLDVSLLRKSGWRYRTTLEEGIKLAYNWYIK